MFTYGMQLYKVTFFHQIKQNLYKKLTLPIAGSAYALKGQLISAQWQRLGVNGSRSTRLRPERAA